MKWDNPRDTPQASVNEFVVTSYQLAAVEYTCGLLRRQLDHTDHDGQWPPLGHHQVYMKGTNMAHISLITLHMP